MRFPHVLLVGLAAVACGARTEGGINATVDFARVDLGRACVRVSVVDLASVGDESERSVVKDIDISDRQLTGSLGIGIARNPVWTDGVEVRASLHRESCTRVSEASDTGRAMFKVNEVQLIRLTLRQSALDGGSAGGGTAAGGSAAGGSAAGGSAAGGSAAGGSAAGGSAAGSSAAGGSAGGDTAGGGTAGGGSAGCPANAVPRFFKIGSVTWNDIAPYRNGFILVGESGAISSFDQTDGGVTDLSGGTCAGQTYLGVSVRPIDQAVFISTRTGSLVRWVAPGQCTRVNALTAGIGTAVHAYDDMIFVGSFDGSDFTTAGTVTLSRLWPDGGVASSQNVSSAGQVWEISGPSSSATFAAGWDHAVQRRNRIWAYESNAGTWTPILSSNENETRLFAIDVPTPTLGFAAGAGFREWDGSTWALLASPPISVYGLKVLSSNEVYAVGINQGSASMAFWNGSTWTLIGPTTRPSGAFNRLRGTSRCTLVAVGSAGNAMTTFP
jgi:hypothetical protein